MCKGHSRSNWPIPQSRSLTFRSLYPAEISKLSFILFSFCHSILVTIFSSERRDYWLLRWLVLSRFWNSLYRDLYVYLAAYCWCTYEYTWVQSRLRDPVEMFFRWCNDCFHASSHAPTSGRNVASRCGMSVCVEKTIDRMTSISGSKQPRARHYPLFILLVFLQSLQLMTCKHTSFALLTPTDMSQSY